MKPRHNLYEKKYIHSFCFFGIRSVAAGSIAISWFDSAGAYRSLRGGPLPVVLVGFIAVPNADKTVTVNWSTQQEINSSLFTIERSADANNWDAIGTVSAKGFSTQVSNYSFTDVSSLNGITYYRLRITNKDGNFGYTQIEIARVSLPTQYLLFPNPAKDYVNISVREAAPVSLECAADKLCLDACCSKIKSKQGRE